MGIAMLMSVQSVARIAIGAVTGLLIGFFDVEGCHGTLWEWSHADSFDAIGWSAIGAVIVLCVIVASKPQAEDG